MHLIPIALALASALLLSTAAAGEPARQAPKVDASTPAAQKDGEDEMICTRERAIGSNRITRVCRSATQQEHERAKARELLERDAVG